MTVKAEKLVRMAEQIIKNMQFNDDYSVVAEKVAAHINLFWDPRMRRSFLDYSENAKADYSKTLQLAVLKINR